ncbi:MAG: M23 family metallopeptidase [Brevinematales bacterium]|nr:M23 family metallopeptidase [Brevinematales bacterium]
MANQKTIPLLLKTGIFLKFFWISCALYGLYWNGSSPLPLPFAEEGAQRVVLDIPSITNIVLSFTYVSNLLVIQPLLSPPKETLRDGYLRIIYPWKEVSYAIRLVTLPPEVSLLHTPSLGRGKSGLFLYRVTSYAPYQTWIVDSTGLVYHPYHHDEIWMTILGWPLSASSYHLKVVVEDAAKNRVEKLIPHVPLKTSYRIRTIPLSSDFSKQQGAEVNLTNLTQDPIKNYEALMKEFAKYTKVSIFDLTYKRPSTGISFFTNLGFLPLSEYTLSSLFGDERRFVLEGKVVRSSYHNGIDFVAPSNTPVFSPWGGRVIFADYNGAGGNTIVVDHGLGLYAIYMHLERIEVKAGEILSPGQTIGVIGKSGYSTGIHLHVGLSVQGRYVDPSDWTNKAWIEQTLILPLQQHTRTQKGEVSLFPTNE